MVKSKDFIKDIVSNFNINLNNYMEKQNIDVLFKNSHLDLLEILSQTLKEYIYDNRG